MPSAHEIQSDAQTSEHLETGLLDEALDREPGRAGFCYASHSASKCGGCTISEE